MKERPILFSAPMVRAILEGRKSQTRRVVKGLALEWLDEHQFKPEFVASPGNLFSPYGYAGDRLWLKETFQYAGWTDDGIPLVRYRADGSTIWRELIPESWSDKLCDIWEELSSPHNTSIDGKAADMVWRPSIFMPRWASRITLEVTDVRVERLQYISESDATAEGAPPSHPSIDVVSRSFGYEDFPRSWYAQLWEQINGAGSWAANPWVWVVEFKRWTDNPQQAKIGAVE